MESMALMSFYCADKQMFGCLFVETSLLSEILSIEEDN